MRNQNRRDTEMRIQTYTLGGVGTHCYVLINEDTK